MTWQHFLVIIIILFSVLYVVWKIRLRLRKTASFCEGCEGCQLKKNATLEEKMHCEAKKRKNNLAKSN